MVQISYGKRAGSHPGPLGMTNESESSEGWHESPGDSSDDPEYAYYWARGTRLYFFDPEVWQHYYQGGASGAVSNWQHCGDYGASKE
jgi:hypothetical protein